MNRIETYPAPMPIVAADRVTHSSKRATKAPIMKSRTARRRSSLGLEAFHGHGIVASWTQVLVKTTVVPNCSRRLVNLPAESTKMTTLTPVASTSAPAPCNPKLALRSAMVAKPYALCQLGASRLSVNAGSLQKSARLMSISRERIKIHVEERLTSSYGTQHGQNDLDPGRKQQAASTLRSTGEEAASYLCKDGKACN